MDPVPFALGEVLLDCPAPTSRLLPYRALTFTLDAVTRPGKGLTKTFVTGGIVGRNVTTVLTRSIHGFSQCIDLLSSGC